MMIAAALFCGFLLDLLLGDPAWAPHPVVFMGRCITRLERILRKILPETPQGQLAGGMILVIVMVLGTLLITTGVCILAAMIHPALGVALQVLWCWQALAIRGLKEESRNVYRCLEAGETLEKSRKAVGRIVGRDTGNLTREGIIKATVETIAENFSDGVLAPMLYICIGGAPLGMTYKAINTMDSMVGYKNDRYLYFGRAAARLDDAAGFLPSRIAALFFILSAGLIKTTTDLPAGERIKASWRMWRRDCRNHASPNSAQTEAACAGALGVQLAGPTCYFGQWYDKPVIGDAVRPITKEDILRTTGMLYAAGTLAAVCFVTVRAALVFCMG